MRRKITIPAAGEQKRFPFTGRSIIIESGSLYDSPEDVPTFQFADGSDDKPIYPQSSFPNDQGKFRTIIVTGTEASAGDEAWLISTYECVEEKINIAHNSAYQPTLKATFTKPASDVAQSLSEAELVNEDGLLPSKIYVWAKGGTTAGINYAFDTAPSQGISADDAGYLDNDPANKTASNPVEIYPLEIVGINFILAFQFIAAVAAETPNIVIQCEY